MAARDGGPCGQQRVPIVAANRVGVEHDQTFYGTSFIADERGDILAELDREERA